MKTNDGDAVGVEIKGSNLIITLKLHAPVPSSTGKTLVVASTQGNKATSVMVEGCPITVGVNAYIKRK